MYEWCEGARIISVNFNMQGWLALIEVVNLLLSPTVQCTVKISDLVILALYIRLIQSLNGSLTSVLKATLQISTTDRSGGTNVPMIVV